MSTEDPLQTVSQVAPRRHSRRASAARVRAIYPPDLEWSISVHKHRVVIGRIASDGTPPLGHSTVSRSHLAIHWDKVVGAHVGTDLGSHNGTRVNGRAVQNRGRELEDNAVLQLGDVFAVYEKNRGLSAPDVPEVSMENIPGESAAIRLVRASVAKAAPDPSPVLLIGETGTGKEWIANEIHRLSGRSGPLVAINCSALSPQIIDSQLFGHVKGAFTGATTDQEGLFRAADGGTLFLDEIGEMPLELQPKLLRVLQDGLVQPVGATRGVAVDVRVLAATNRDLSDGIERGEFRRDLYARLALWEITVPPLRERRVDILAWIDRLHRAWCAQREGDYEPLELFPDAVESLMLCDWPDNLRGIDRMIHDLATRVGDGRVGAEDLPTWLPDGAPDTDTGDLSSSDIGSTDSVKADRREKPPIPDREEFERVFEELDGNVRAMAKHFQRDRRQIYRWLQAFGLSARRKRMRKDDSG